MRPQKVRPIFTQPHRIINLVTFLNSNHGAGKNPDCHILQNWEYERRLFVFRKEDALNWEPCFDFSSPLRAFDMAIRVRVRTNRSSSLPGASEARTVLCNFDMRSSKSSTSIALSMTFPT